MQLRIHNYTGHSPETPLAYVSKLIYGSVLCIQHQVLLWMWFLLMLLYLYVLDKIYRVFWQSVSMAVHLTTELVPGLRLAPGSVLKFAPTSIFFEFWQDFGVPFRHQSFYW